MRAYQQKDMKVMKENMFCHRPVQTSDYQQVVHFVRNEEELFFSFPHATYPLSTEMLAQTIAGRSGATVVEYAGQPCAFADFYKAEPGRYCVIGNVLVAPAFRRQGVGRYLIATMIALAQAHYQVPEVRISCFSGNTAGLLLYHRLGFVPYAMEDRETRDGDTVLLLHLSLRVSAV